MTRAQHTNEGVPVIVVSGTDHHVRIVASRVIAQSVPGTLIRSK
jgi:hypothetical protein